MIELKSKQELIDEWRKEYGYKKSDTDEEIWYDKVLSLHYLYDDLKEDDEWYNILNCLLREKYGVWFIDANILKIQVNNVKMATDKVNDILNEVAKRIHKGLKNNNIKWLEAIDKTEESFIGQNNY